MPFVMWDDSFVLGMKQFDEDHQVLVALLNLAYDDFITDAPPESVNSILDKLVDYAIYHFGAEEYWMEQQSYPKLDEHRAEHDRFSSKVVEMLKYHSRNNMLLEVLTFLNNWLTTHILKSDAEYGRYNTALLVNPIFNEIL
jgi:hemerythrin